MARIIIVACKRIQDVTCVSCMKCFKGMRERVGEFARYQNEPLELVALGDCGDCPGLVMPKLVLIRDLAKLLDSDFDVVHLGTCIVKATKTAKCPIDLEATARRIKEILGKEVVIGTHPW
ncbi:CGGC domain-containing protein [Desulfothermobacter acidiphilus]|uniref:CGGC domain-containing protein n=1 Tax=Desulfothermobacter acidiphilus TaxID=1938353 RepID=UPI003F8B7EE8